MKRLLLILLLLLLTKVNASHQKADEITYIHLGGYTYRATLTSYTFTGTATDRPLIEIDWGDGTIDTVARKIQTILPDADRTYLNIYEAEHTYAGAGAYYISMTDPTRNGGVVNIPNSIDISMYVQTLLVISPFFPGGNNSAILTNRPIDRACVGQPFIHNPGAYDPDGDSLSYKLIRCRTEGGMDVPGYTFPVASTSLSIDEVTGDVLWDAPINQGEYNIAILVEEWRYGRKISEITRDMQITVQQCNNRPPVLTVQNYCAIAGDTLLVPIKAHDPDGDAIKITATGEPFMLPEEERPVLLSLNDTSVLFSWLVPYSAPRKSPYIIYSKATDFGDPNLSDLKEFTINVVAPAPVITSLRADDNGNPQLHFTRTPVPHAVGYNIYRHNGTSDPVQDSCSGGLQGEGFAFIATTQNTFYTDTLQLQNGMMYCYRVTVLLQDGSESLFSDEECFTIQQQSVPIFTHTSIEKTHPYQGVVKVRWIMLPNDTNSEYGSKQFVLYRAEIGETGDTLKQIRTFPFDTAVTFYDSLRNTEEDIQRYFVILDDTTAKSQQTQPSIQSTPPPAIPSSVQAQPRIQSAPSPTPPPSLRAQQSNPEQAAIDTLTANPAKQTAVSSTLRLQAFPYSHKVVLRWQDNQLWQNRYYRVYRAPAATPATPAAPPDYIQIARVADILYADTNVANDSTYTYYIEGEGTYFNTQIESPMLNKSNEALAMPQVQPPCPPQIISVEGSCGSLENAQGSSLKNTLQWIMDCDPENIDDIVEYGIYSARAGDTNYIFTTSIQADEVSIEIKENKITITADDDNPTSYRLCYVVTAINSKGQESEYSNAVCVDNRNCFTLNLPNIFTPNGDGTNDVFRPKNPEKAPKIEHFEIQIFDRWGKLVFKTNKFPFEWNGCYMNGNNASPDGAYFYVIEFSAPAEDIPIKQIQSGSVVILR
ncbi:MAG: gliding motility-associated C-terminal domain-containing protein [Bacteroidales bacterium]|nr:gliding motility-associated C-terminal domain-containing protein [Bacteroidales bacterium]